MKTRLAAGWALPMALSMAGCAIHAPVVADVRCPRGATMVVAPGEGLCILRDGTRHGPSWKTSAAGVEVDGYDHGALAGPYQHWDSRGVLVERGFRPGVTDSTDPKLEVGSARFDSPQNNGELVWPSRVRVFPVQADATFSASTLVSSDGRSTSSFLGAAFDVAMTPAARVRHRGDAYQAGFLSYGAQGVVGRVARSECDDPTIAGSGGFCGTRWLAGPFVRIGYFRSEDAQPKGALPSLLGYGRVGFLLGEDRWSSTYSSGSALVWRLRLGAGYTAFGAVAALARHASAEPTEGWRWLLLPIAILLEHAEGYVDLGGDGGGALGVGAGIDVGFGL